MKKMLIVLAIWLPIATMAQEPLFAPIEMPNTVRFLPTPPEDGSPAFEYDKAQYRWGKSQREDSARLNMAVGDAVWSVDNICHIMSQPLGIKISADATPAIYKLLCVALISTDQVGKIPKEHYKRIRPYVYFNEPTIAPGDEDALRGNGSYPSGHTILGWSAALLLTEIAPDSADAILARGYAYGQSRVIAGYHWQSDVDAARLAASAAVAKVHSDPQFERLMRKAKREYRKVINKRCK